MEPSGSLPSAGTAWTTGTGDAARETVSHKGPRVCSPGLVVVTLASWELPCNWSPRRKLQGCAMSPRRGSHSQRLWGWGRRELCSIPCLFIAETGGTDPTKGVSQTTGSSLS